MASKTTYAVVTEAGATLFTNTKKQRAIDWYETDTTKESVAVVALPSGTVVHGALANTAVLSRVKLDNGASAKATEKIRVKAKTGDAAAPKAKQPRVRVQLTDEQIAERNEARKAAAKAKRHELMARAPHEVHSPDEKQCRRCKETKPAEGFNKDYSVADGLRQWCKACYSDYAKARRAAAAPATA
jgi:hypothetical protein